MKRSLFFCFCLCSREITGIFPRLREKNFSVAFFSDTLYARSFKLRMITAVLRVYILVMSVMTLTFLKVTGVSEIQTANCFVRFLCTFLSTANAIKMLYGCYMCVFKGDKWCVFGWSSVWIFSGTKTVIKVKLCVKVLLIELSLFVTLSVTLTLFEGHSSVKQFQLKSLCS